MKQPEYLIQITQDDINVAREQDQGHCPVARAIAHQVEFSQYITVTRDEIRFTLRNSRLRHVWRTPRSAQVFIDALDTYGTVKVHPFAFTLGGSDLIEIRSMRERSPGAVGRGTVDNAPKNPGRVGAYNRRTSTSLSRH